MIFVVLLRCMSQELALSGRAKSVRSCPLSEAHRKSSERSEHFR